MTFIRKVKAGQRTYLAEVRSIRKGGKVRQEFIRYIGREMDGKAVRRIAIDDISTEGVKQSSDVLAIDKIAEELSLKSLSSKHALALAYSQLLESRSISKIEDWLRFTEIPEVLGIKSHTVKELYESLTDINDESFGRINAQMSETFRKCEKPLDAAIIDVTDTYFAGTGFDTKKRKGKDHRVSKLVQIGLAVSFNNGFPILHKQYHGNLSGMDIFKDMTLELKSIGISSVVIDRGMSSLDNLKMAKMMGFKIIAGVRKTEVLSSRFISKTKRDDIYSAANRIRLKNTSVFAKEFDYLGGKLIVVYNPSLEVVKKELDFERERESAADTGYSLIYHNTEYPADVVVRKYYDKEMVERAFRHLKGVLKLRPIRVWLKEHISGHVKICYLAYAILSLMNYRLKKLDISAVDALQSLKQGYRVDFKDKKTGFKWSTCVSLEPKQKSILKALGVVTKK